MVILGAVAELRTLVLSALLKDPDLFDALARSRAEAPSGTPLDSLLWIIASYEAEDGGIGA